MYFLVFNCPIEASLRNNTSKFCLFNARYKRFHKKQNCPKNVLLLRHPVLNNDIIIICFYTDTVPYNNINRLFSEVEVLFFRLILPIFFCKIVFLFR